MKKKNLILLLAMTIGLLTACQSGVSKDAYESLENRASQAEEERDALKNSFDELSITHESLKESISIEQESKNSKQETPSMRFDEHIPLNTTDLQAIYDVTNGNNEEMLTAAVLPLVDIGIAPDNMEILGLENFEKITIPDNGKANTGFRVDLIFNTDKYKLSCVLYYFDSLDSWTYVGVKNYDKMHWYCINKGMGIDIKLYDYETDMLIK